MPNWCYNRLTINASSKEGVKQAKKFVKKAKHKGDDNMSKTDLSLANLYPEPDYEKVEVLPTFPEIRGNNKPVEPKSAWWDWRVQNWGTKWDIQADGDVDISDDYVYITYAFDSAWSPPVEWLKKVSADYPELQFTLRYEEEGMGFMGRAKAKAGEMDDQSLDF